MPEGFDGAIFDVDGVLVDSPHEAAWREVFRELMESDWADIRDQTTWSPEAFTPGVYQQVLSGKPRMEGAMAALEHFGVPEPQQRVAAYAERKQEMVVDLIKAGKFSAYPDALRFLLAVKDAGLRVAAASSSKNAGLFLRQIRLDTFAEQEGLGPPLRAGQAPSGDLPHRRAGARHRPDGGVRHRGRGLRRRGGEGRRVRGARPRAPRRRGAAGAGGRRPRRQHAGRRGPRRARRATPRPARRLTRHVR